MERWNPDGCRVTTKENCGCAPGSCRKFGTDINRAKVPGHPEHPGYLRAFPERSK